MAQVSEALTAEFMCGNTSTHNKYTVDLQVCQNVLEQRRNILGDEHPATLRTRSNIAFLHMQMGKPNEACQMYQEVLENLLESFEKEIANREISLDAYQNNLEIADHSQEKQEQPRLEQLFDKRCIITDERKVTESENQNIQSPPMPPPPPPPPLVMNMPPHVSAPLKHDETKKNRPQPLKKLKSFNWSKLPNIKMQGTIWSKIDETKWYENMQLQSLDKLFSAYEKDNVVNESSHRTDQRNRKKVSSVIDVQRSLNGSILLSNLKMSDNEFSLVLLSMDSNEQLSIDMLEMLLKFTPSAKESTLLEEYSSNIESLDTVERFLYAISKIPNYEQRLKSLLYKKRFMKTVEDISCRIKKVVEASHEVAQSERLKKILESVLFLGNYMKPEANASGFRLASLNRLSDTKSSSLNGTTLLHFLVQVFEKEDKDLLQLEKDIPHVREACKESLDEMNKDIVILRTGLEDIFREINSYQSVDGDRFLHVLTEFYGQASVRLAELEGRFLDMKTKFDQAICFFGEDGSIVQPIEFFGIFDTFLTAFKKAERDNEHIRERQERGEKLVKQKAELIERKIKEGQMSSVAIKVETNDSMSALRNMPFLRQRHREDSRERPGGYSEDA